MSLFDELTPEQKENRRKITEENLKKSPTPEETLWFEFAFQNRGFKFMKKVNGKKISVLQFFLKHKDNPRILNLATENLLDDWRRVVKVGWTVVDLGFGVQGAMLDEDIPTYNKTKDIPTGEDII